MLQQYLSYCEKLMALDLLCWVVLLSGALQLLQLPEKPRGDTQRLMSAVVSSGKLHNFLAIQEVWLQ